MHAGEARGREAGNLQLFGFHSHLWEESHDGVLHGVAEDDRQAYGSQAEKDSAAAARAPACAHHGHDGVFGAREKLPTPAFQNWPRHSDLNPFHEPMRGDLKHHHARGPEETVCDLPAVVPAGRASREPPTCLRESGMPDVAAAEDPSRLAPPEPRL